MKGIPTLIKIKKLCFALDQDPKGALDNYVVKQLNTYLKETYYSDLGECHQMFLSTMYCLCSLIKSAKENQRIVIVDTLDEILRKFQFRENEEIEFGCIHICLIKEICNPAEENSVQKISEEYKLSIIQCLATLMDSTSRELLPKIFKQKNVPWLSATVHVCTKLARNEKFRSLRVAAVNCITAMARINEDDDFRTTESSQLIADTFILFLPGITGTLMKICSEEEKSGHSVIAGSLKAWGRIVVLLMRSTDEPAEDFEDVLNATEEQKCEEPPKNKFETRQDVMEYISTCQDRNAKWYQSHDKKLEMCMPILNKLTISQHPEIRRELVTVCDLLLIHCSSTIPKTVGRSIEILIALSEDEYEDIAGRSKVLLYGLSEKMSQDSLKMATIRENLEHNFYGAITKLPRIFNGLDRREQLVSLNLLIGYLSLFGEHRLKLLLFTYGNLNRLILSLLNIAALKNTDVSLLEEYSPQELDMNPDTRTPWKVFNFQDKEIQTKLETACHLLAQPDISEIVLDFLTDTFENDAENRKEATLIINEVLSVGNSEGGNVERIKHTITMYLDRRYWALPSIVVGDGKNKCTVGEVQNNIIQMCLQLEGIGKMALALKTGFREFLLKVLYVVLEKAGSGHPLLSAAGLTAVTNISVACGYKNVTELVNKNSDYFSHHVMQKLKRPNADDGVFNVLTVVMKHSNIDVLPAISEIVEGVLLQSCDKFQADNADPYLRVFKSFIKALYQWLDVSVETPSMKTKEEREKEVEDFRVSNLAEVGEDFSDEAVMGKTAEEMWLEDLAKTKTDLENEMEPEDEQHEEPPPPMHIRLSAAVLRRSLNFLPSKKVARKILVLEILKDGVEVLRDWENELLPIVHLIWSPLVERFREFSTPLIINLSFRLLATLARLSKDFIRQRTVKDVFPQLCMTLIRQSKESYLKDKGSAYRYTQGYKMQLAIVPELGRLVYDLDTDESGLRMVAVAVEPYLSNRQPIPLQEAALNFYKSVLFFDAATGERLIAELDERMTERRAKNNTEYNKNHLLINNSEHR